MDGALWIVVFTSSVLAIAAPKSEEEYWLDTRISFDQMAEDLITNTNCYEDDRALTACIVGFNEGLSVAKQRLALVPADRFSEDPSIGKLVEDLGELKLIERPPFQTKSPVKRKERFVKERAALNQSTAKLYKKTKDKPISFEDLKVWLKKREVFQKKESYLTARLVNGVLSVSEDPHTAFVPYQMQKDETSGMEKSVVGIGVRMRIVQYKGSETAVIEKSIEGGPAYAAGIRQNDIIVAIDGQNVSVEELTGVSDRIRGEEGTQIKITVSRNGGRKEFAVTRGKVKFPNVEATMLDDGKVPLGYVRLDRFMEDKTCEEFNAAVVKLEKDGAKGIIFDLRMNGGGRLDHAVCVANTFLKKSTTVVVTKDLREIFPDESLETADTQVTALPMVTLVDWGSASASEIVSGALQDHRRSWLVGERTYGKATVQSVLRHPSLPILLRKTTARFYLPSGRTNQIEGNIPDFEVLSSPKPTEDEQFSFREEDHYLALPALGNPWKQPRPSEASTIRKCIAESGTALKKFDRGSDQPLVPDYRLLYAQDVLNCASDLRLTNTNQPSFNALGAVSPASPRNIPAFEPILDDAMDV